MDWHVWYSSKVQPLECSTKTVKGKILSNERKFLGNFAGFFFSRFVSQRSFFYDNLLETIFEPGEATSLLEKIVRVCPTLRDMRNFSFEKLKSLGKEVFIHHMGVGESDNGKQKWGKFDQNKYTNSKNRIRPGGICMFKVNNRNTRARCEICLKLTIKTPEHLLLTLNIFHTLY